MKPLTSRTLSIPFSTATATAITRALTVLGAAYISNLALKLSRFVWHHYLRPHTNLIQRYANPDFATSTNFNSKTYSAWAVVTGATSGIGRGCARVLAQHGFHIVLMARSTLDLNTVAAELRDTYGVKTMIVVMDAAQCSETQIDDFIRQLEHKSVAILVNAVGILNERPEMVEEMEFSLARTILLVNCCFTILLTSRLIPLLKAHASRSSPTSSTQRYNKRCHAAIVNIGSLTSSSPFPFQATYAATKSFLAHWSCSLAAELKPDFVDVVCVRPGLTQTRMTSHYNELSADKCHNITTAATTAPPPRGMFVADADDLARRALGMLGRNSNVVDILPYPPHAFLDWVGRSLVPEWIQGAIMRTSNMERQLRIDEQRQEQRQRGGED